MANNVSNLGMQLTSIAQVKDIQTKMAGYQQQIATGVKSQTFAGYGPDASRIQSYRSDLASANIYLYNIQIAQTSIDQMNQSLTETAKQAGNVLSAMSVQLTKGDGFDLNTIKSAAAAALQIVQANMNASVDGKFLFAGTDVTNTPYANASTATSNIQAEISDWLDGTNNTADFLSQLDGLTDSQLGYSTTVQTSKNIYVRADDNLEVDYTAKANEAGFKKIVTALTALANMKMPTTGDIPSKDNFYDAVNSLYRTIQAGVESIRDTTVTVATASQIINDIKNAHQNDKQAFQKTLETTEATDTTDAVIKFQSLQTQLDASYRVTSILSQLSLARLL